MKTFNELVKKLSKKDNTPVERLELSKVRSTLEEQCEKYLVDTDDIYQFEALPSAINFIIEILDMPSFTEKYEYAQVSETVFEVRLKSLDLL